MHRVAELGAAAHWSYKDETASLPWLQIIGEWEAQVDSASVFMELVRNELLGSRVFVFAPQGRILNLAKGATLNDAVAHVIQGGDWGIDVQGGASERSGGNSRVERSGCSKQGGNGCWGRLQLRTRRRGLWWRWR